MTIDSLVRNWWMIAIRGFLAITFGITIYAWPGVTLPLIVAMFGVYAIADGAWAVAAGVYASARIIDTWPIWLEGVVSVALGLVALFHPFVPREILWELTAWGVVTGAIEMILAFSVPRTRPAHTLLITGAVSSLFLALLLVMLPHAGETMMARVIIAYAQVFGVALILAAADFAREHRRARAHHSSLPFQGSPPNDLIAARRRRPVRGRS
jgi:uncharacterized membrane protein HdeD (DUF308 family)